MQCSNHREGERALTVQDLRNARTGADQHLELLAGEPSLFQTELDGIDGIGIHECREYVELVVLTRPWKSVP